MKTDAEIRQSFLEMQTSDTYALLCSFMYEMKDIPEYTVLSELCYLLDKDSFEKLFKYFSGMTIKIPTQKELVEAIQVLKLYQYYEIEHRPWKDCVLMAGLPSSGGKMAHNNLERLKETMKKYNFGNRDY